MQAKDLIVLGSSRLLGKLYCGDIDIGGSASISTISSALSLTNTTDSSSTTTGALKVSGGVGIAKKLYIGGNTYHSGSTYFGSTYNISSSGQATLSQVKVGTGSGDTTITNNSATIANINSSTITNSGNISNKNGIIETDEIQSNVWNIVSTQNLGGDFFVAPTIMVTEGSTFYINSISNGVIAGYIVDSTNITSDSFAGHSWTSGSKIKLTGKITKDSNSYILGTCDGTLTANMNSSSGRITFSVTCKSATPPTATGSYTISDGTVMMYSVGGTNKVGIYMTSYGIDHSDYNANNANKRNKYSYIDIFNGSDGSNPKVRIGKLNGLPAINSISPEGYGIYTTNGYFEGKVVANGGKIGGWTIGDGYITSNSNRTTYNATTVGITIDKDGIGAGNGSLNTFYLKHSDGSMMVKKGSIAGWRIEGSYLASGTATAPAADTILLSPSGTSSPYNVGGKNQSGWVLTAGTTFGVDKTGGLYASNAYITGEITASKLTIASGATISGDGANQILNSEIDIGGKNILRGTDTLTIASGSWTGGVFYKSGSGGTVENVTLPSTPIPSITKGLKVTITTANTNIGFAQGSVPIRKQEITQSVWIKGTAGDIVILQPIYSSTSGSEESGQKTITIADSNWNRYTFTKTVNYDHLSTDAAAGYVYVKSATTGRVLYICADKLEYGNIATDWTPAPEDVDIETKKRYIFVQGTQTGKTGTWTGTTSELSSLEDGQVIYYYLPYAGSGNATLNLTLANGTTTGAKNCYYSGTSRLTTHFGAGMTIPLVYHKALTINSSNYEGWWTLSQYNVDTWENRINYFGGKTSSSKGIWATGLFMEDGNGTFQSICTASDGTVTSSNRTTATTKKANTNGFKVGSPIWYSNTSYDANKNISGSGAIYSCTSLIDSRYSFNTMTGTTSAGTTGMTTYKPIYLVGSVGTDGLFKLDSTWYTQTPNTTNKVYILVGAIVDVTGSGSAYYYRFCLYETNTWYVYDGSKLVDYSEYASKVATNCITEISNTGIWVTPKNNKPNSSGAAVSGTTTGTLINADGVGIYKDGTKVAQYGEDVTIGVADGSQSYAKFDYHSMQLFAKGETKPYFHVSDLRNQNGIATLKEKYIIDTTDDEFDPEGTTEIKVNANISEIIHIIMNDVDVTTDTELYTIDATDRRFIIFDNSKLTDQLCTIEIEYSTLDKIFAMTFGVRKENSNIGAYSVCEGQDITASGYCSHAEGTETTASSNFSHAEGSRTTASGMYSHAEGNYTTASGESSHAEGRYATASGWYSHAEGYATTASTYYSHAEGARTLASGMYSHAEGDSTIASGMYSHAEGYNNTTASGNYSHAEGYNTKASGSTSHAEGYGTIASGSYSHAEGYNGTTASGKASHAQNYHTISQGAYQTAIGKFNIAQGSNSIANTDHAFIIGNGTSDDARSNALTVDWNGTITANGYICNNIGGNSSTTHASTLKTWFNNNKSSISRNTVLSYWSSSYGNGSQYIGYFLNGYDTSPYGGFFVCHYTTPWYVGISNGSYTQYELTRTATSSRKTKENIKLMKDDEAKKLYDLDVISFDYKKEYEEGKKNQFGLIAEDCDEIIPYVVNKPDDNEDSIWGIDYVKFVPYLIKNLQLHEQKIKELEKEIEILKSQNK